MSKPLPRNELLRVMIVFDRLTTEQRAELIQELQAANERSQGRGITKPAKVRTKDASADTK